MPHRDPCGNLAKAKNTGNLTDTDNSDNLITGQNSGDSLPPYRKNKLEATGLVPGSSPATPDTPGAESRKARRARPPKWG